MKNNKTRHNLTERLQDKGPKRILALDGGGIRGAITLGFLEKMESILRQRHNNPDLLLCDYFDLIGGTSTGGIIASALAIGMSAGEIRQMYLDLGGQIFGKKRKPWVIGGARKLLKANYDHSPLEKQLHNIFGDTVLGDQEKIRTGLCITAKRADTFSTWALINHPGGKFYQYNKDIRLVDALRATSAAPTYFLPKTIRVGGQEIGAFIDGGVSLANNPAFLLFLVATLNGFPFQWSTGEDKMLITSVGTGVFKKKIKPEKVPKMGPLDWASNIPELFMEDAQYFNQMLLQAMSDSPTARFIDLEVGNLSNDFLFGKKMLSYFRYNVNLDNRTPAEKKRAADGHKFFKLDEYGFQFSEDQLTSLRQMDRAENRFTLADIGKAASIEVLPEHFPPAFDLTDNPRDVLLFKTFERPALPFRKAVKRPIPIEACQMDKPFRVESMEGIVEGQPGDWLMRGVKGELYVCSKDVFEKTYDLES